MATLAAALVACGGASEAAAPSPSPSPSPSPVASPTPTPGLTFKLSGVNGSKAAGTITVFATATMVTIELHITGLAPDSSHVSHVHSGSCQKVGGIIFALNQVVVDGNGDADTRTTLQAKYPPATGHWYVVVHAGPDMQGSNSAYLLCGNLF
jgi:hypothetical protein